MTRTSLAAALAVFILAQSLPAACTGACVTKEYRITEALCAWNVTYERNDSTYYASHDFRHVRIPRQRPQNETASRGTSSAAERALINALRNLARSHAEANYQQAMDSYIRISSDEGTTNTCSTGCECGEGEFSTEDATIPVVSGGSGSRTIETRDRQGRITTRGYTYMWGASGVVDYIRRVKSVDCVFLEP